MLPDGVTLVATVPDKGELVYFDTEKFEEKKRVTVDFKPKWLAVQNDTLFCAVWGAATVVALDAETAKRKAVAELPGVGVSRIACHPRGGPLFASNENYEVLTIDTRRMTATKTRAVGKHLEVAPTGDYLYTGVQPQSEEQLKIIERMDGSIELIWDTWGRRASMLKYIVRGRQLQLVAMCDNAAVNASCLALSADGSTVAMAGGGGWRPEAPLRGGGYQVSFFRSKDMTSMAGKVDIGAYPQHVVFHPILDLGVAQQGGTKHRLIVFDGKSFIVKEEFDLGKGPAPTGLITFGNRGRTLVYASSKALHAIPLNLTEEQLKALDAWQPPGLKVASPTTPDEVEPPAARRETVSLVDLDALKQGTATKELSPKEIGRQFMRSVVVIRGGDSSGTGFVVGREGYILTCAHVLNPATSTVVSYRGADGSTAMARASLVREDREKDLALLKVEGRSPLPPVRLALSAATETGERVTVIGNPGLGRTILEHTMTEGIVSNPGRDLDGQRFIQTSASVNPGSSGGPMFNSRGEVIGIVVLKANIEGAGFAVPSSDIVPFLFEAAQTRGAAGQITRTWTDSSGAHRLEAQYQGFVGRSVKLKRADSGQVLTLPIEKLSKADQEFLRLLYYKNRE
jgi:S1-C subfamily serine protease